MKPWTWPVGWYVTGLAAADALVILLGHVALRAYDQQASRALPRRRRLTR